MKILVGDNHNKCSQQIIFDLTEISFNIPNHKNKDENVTYLCFSNDAHHVVCYGYLRNFDIIVLAKIEKRCGYLI